MSRRHKVVGSMMRNGESVKLLDFAAIAPALEHFAVNDLARRMGVSAASLRFHRRHGQVPADYLPRLRAALHEQIAAYRALLKRL